MGRKGDHRRTVAHPIPKSVLLTLTVQSEVSAISLQWCILCLVKHACHRKYCSGIGCDFLRLFWCVIGGCYDCLLKNLLWSRWAFILCERTRCAETIRCMSFHITYSCGCKRVFEKATCPRRHATWGCMRRVSQTVDFTLSAIVDHDGENVVDILIVWNKRKHTCCWRR